MHSDSLTTVLYVLILLQKKTRERLFTSVSGCDWKYTGVSAGQEMVSSAHNAYKVQVFLFLVAKIESALQATETTFCLKIDVKTIRFIYIFCGDFSPPLSAHCYLLKLSVPWQAGQIKGICYHLVFVLNGYTCGTSGSKPDSLLTFLCSILCSHGNCCMFGRKLLKAVEKEREPREGA